MRIVAFKKFFLALLILAPMTTAVLNVGSSVAFADTVCGKTKITPLDPKDVPEVVPDFSTEKYDLPLNPNCNAYTPLYSAMKAATLRWSLGTFRSLYYSGAAGGGRVKELKNGIASEIFPCAVTRTNPNGYAGYDEQVLLAEEDRACTDDAIATIRKIFAVDAIISLLPERSIQLTPPTALDIIFRNPTTLTTGNSQVLHWLTLNTLFANSVLILFMGVALVRYIIARATKTPYDLRSIFTRLFIGMVFLLFWGVIARSLLEFGTALSLYFAETNPITNLIQHGPFEVARSRLSGAPVINAESLLTLINPTTDKYINDIEAISATETMVTSFYAWCASLLAMAAAVRIMVMAVLIAVGPLGLVATIFPDTRRLGRIWSNLFMYTLFLQPLMAAILWSGAVIVLGMGDAMGATADTPGQFPFVLTLLFSGIAILGSFAATFAALSAMQHMDEAAARMVKTSKRLYRLGGDAMKLYLRVQGGALGKLADRM